MKIDKAIEILQDILRHVQPIDPPDEHDAITLGIEALKHLQKSRQYNLAFNSETLPGETEAPPPEPSYQPSLPENGEARY